MCSTGAAIDATKIDLAPWGYAPGSSIITCADCQRTKSTDDSMHIAHKHGYRCVAHALEAYHSAIRAQEGVLTPELDQELSSAALGLDSVASDQFVRQAFLASIILTPAIIAAVLLI